MKAMILVLSPRESRDLLNGDLSVLVRKKFPKDYVGWVYAYCMKGEELCWSYTNLCTDVLPKEIEKQFKHFGTRAECEKEVEAFIKKHNKGAVSSNCVRNKILNGKVVARFWCDKVEEISIDYSPTYETGKWASHYEYRTNSMYDYDLKEKSCLSFKELDDYLLGGEGYAIHITKLEIFDKPKEISEFWSKGEKVKGHKGTYQYSQLTRAPRSGWRYVRCRYGR